LRIPFPLLSSILDYKSALDTHFYYYGKWEHIHSKFR
jgi:hypothetical protein